MTKADIATGQHFRAVLRGYNTTGVVHKSRSGIYLCQNEVVGSNSPNKHGYKYSYFIPLDRKGDLDFARERVTGFTIIKTPVKKAVKVEVAKPKKAELTVEELEKKLAEAKAKRAEKEAKKMPTRLRSWNINRMGNTYQFGCGAVTVTPEEIRRFVNIYHQMRSRVNVSTDLDARRAVEFFDEAVDTANRILQHHK